MNLGAWVKAARERAGLTQEQLGDKLRVTKANVSSWEHDRHKPSHEQVVRIGELTGLTVPSMALQGIMAGRTVPLIDRIHAGQWKNVVEGRSIDDVVELVSVTRRCSQSSFAMKVEGDSMMPTYSEGDVLVVDPEAPLKPGCLVVASNARGESIFRQYKIHKTDKSGQVVFKLVPLNDAYPVIFSNEEQIKVIGPVLEHHRFPY